MSRENFKPYLGREFVTRQMGFFRYNFDHSVGQSVFPVATLARGTVIRELSVMVHTAFAGAKVKFGTSVKCDDMSESDVGSQGHKKAQATATKWVVPSDEEITIYAKLDKKVDSGKGSILVLFANNVNWSS